MMHCLMMIVTIYRAREDRKCQGGGVAIHIRSMFNYQILQDLGIEGFEGISVKVWKPVVSHFACYRPPVILIVPSLITLKRFYLDRILKIEKLSLLVI